MTILKTTRTDSDGKQTTIRREIGGWTNVSEPGDETPKTLKGWTPKSREARETVLSIRSSARVVRKESIDEKGTIVFLWWSIFDGREQLASFPLWSGNRPAAWRSARRYLRERARPAK